MLTEKGRNSSSCPFPVITFINEEATFCINEEVFGAINDTAIGAIVAPRNPPSNFIFVYLLHLSKYCYQSNFSF